MGSGFSCFLEGINLATSAKYRKYVIWPALVSLVVISVGLYIAFGFVADVSAWIAGFGVWPGVIEWVLEPLLYIMGVLVGAWLFGFLSVILGSPFHGLLNAEIHPSGQPNDRAWYQEIGPALLRELSKLKYTLPRLLGLLLLGFIPGINIFAPFLWLGYGGWLMAVQFGDFSFENRQRPFTETVDALRPHRMTCIGFGALVSLGMSIPLLNFVVAPIAVAGGAKLMQTIDAC